MRQSILVVPRQVLRGAQECSPFVASSIIRQHDDTQRVAIALLRADERHAWMTASLDAKRLQRVCLCRLESSHTTNRYSQTQAALTDRILLLNNSAC